MIRSMKVVLMPCLLLIVSSCASVDDEVRIKTSSVPDAQVGVFYDFQFEGQGGAANNIWFVREGVLPNGISLAANGRLSGTPVVPGSFTFTVIYTSNRHASDLDVAVSVGVGYNFGGGSIGVRSGPILGPTEVVRDSKSFTLTVKP